MISKEDALIFAQQNKGKVIVLHGDNNMGYGDDFVGAYFTMVQSAFDILIETINNHNGDLHGIGLEEDMGKPDFKVEK